MKNRTLYARPELHTYLDQSVDTHHQAVVATILALFELVPGDRVLEVGAGTGRYTRSLLDHGLRVVALEPDPVLCRKLREHQASSNLTILEGSAGEIPGDLPSVDAVGGFHVLHHFDEPALRALSGDIRRVATRNPRFRGWFFMEPNPFNALYPIQIALSPGMRFREEKGIWRRNYAEIFRSEGLEFRVLGHLGRIPPAVCRRLPESWQARFRPRLRAGRSLTALYRVVGGRPASAL